jgi:cytidylate kinase
MRSEFPIRGSSRISTVSSYANWMAQTSRGRRARPPFVVAIDGPAGAGKSTVARGVARRLSFAHLDTGAMYRAVTAKALDQGIDPEDGRALAALARETAIDFRKDGLWVDGRKAGRELRARRVNRAVSAVSAQPGVRKELVRVQRSILSKGDVVAEGRDIGTVVFPRAPVKVFLTASIAERARRRHKEMAADGTSMALSTLKRDIARRDGLDSTRKVSPLVPATDAIVLDTTRKTSKQVIDEVEQLVRARMDGASPKQGRTR